MSEELEKEFEQREMERRKEESFPIRNIGLVLLEIFPVEKKEALLEGLKKLYENSEIPSLLTMEGVLGAGWSHNFPIVASKDSTYWPGEGLIKKDIPKPFKLIEVLVGQYYQFCYYLQFNCIIRSEFQSGIAESYIAEHNYDQIEPKIRDYQRQIESFLATYLPGMFLSQRESTRLRCPSIRILLTDDIDFDDFEKWTGPHFGFLRYLGLDGPASRLGPYLVEYQPDHLFKEQGIFGGFTFVCSQSDYRQISQELETELTDNVAFHFRTALIMWFVTIYWATYKLECELPEWENKLSPLEEELRGLLAARKYAISSIGQIYSNLLLLQIDYEAEALSEEKRISIIRRTLSRRKGLKSDKALVFFKIEFDVLQDFSEGLRYLDEERDLLAFVRRKITSSVDQCKQYNDFALQTSMRTLTLAAVVLALVALFVPFAKEIWVRLWPFLQWLFDKCNSIL